MSQDNSKKTELGGGPGNPAIPLAQYSATRKIPIGGGQHICYISGTTARGPDGHIPPFGNVYTESMAMRGAAAAIQTNIVLAKIAAAIKETSGGHGGLHSLVELTIFVKDLQRDYKAINDSYNTIISTAFPSARDSEDGAITAPPLPARTCVQVSAMPPDERTLVEMKGVAIFQEPKTST